MTNHSEKLASAYCRLYDAERALDRARATFEAELLIANAEEIGSARNILPEKLATDFSTATEYWNVSLRPQFAPQEKP